MGELQVFEYLGSLVTAVGRIEVEQRVMEGSKVLGEVRNVLNFRTVS